MTHLSYIGIGSNLARASHKLFTAAVDKPMSTASRSKKVLNIALAMPPRFFRRVPCIQGLLHRLATKVCGKRGLGDKLANCKSAVERINSEEKIEVLKISNWYETTATVDGLPSNQPNYINGVAQISTSLGPIELLSTLMKIEMELGRPHPRPKNAPRTIDLDILFYDDLIVDLPDLKIPHPEVSKRLFVLKPLCDIAPEHTHPLLKKSAQELKNLLL